MPASELSSFQKEIRASLEEYEILKKVNVHINEIDLQLKEAYAKIKSMDKQMDKELKDIEQLEKIGIKSLFYKTLGNKEDQLDKERQEYLELSLKYKEYKKEVELMEYERDLLSKKLSGVGDLEQRIKQLKQSRQNEILSGRNDPLRNELKDLVHRQDVNYALQVEIDQAIQEGAKCLKTLENIIGHLRQSTDWGRWDMYGNDRRAKYIKQRSIEQALRLIPNAQHQLNLFTRELRDLGEKDIVLKLDAVHFNKFRDFFFDNLISDWIIQQRIRNTLSNIEGTHAHVKRICLTLNQESKVLKKKIEELKSRQDQILTA